MRIFEIKATPYPYTVKYNPSHKWGPTLEAVFTTREGDAVSSRLTYSESEDAIGFGFKRNDRSEITHGGDQFRILMTVVDFVQNHLSKMLAKHDPTVFYFSADVSEPSRVKLYKNRASPIISRILGSEWTGPETKSFTDSAGFTDMNYIWRKSVDTV